MKKFFIGAAGVFTGIVTGSVFTAKKIVKKAEEDYNLGYKFGVINQLQQDANLCTNAGYTVEGVNAPPKEQNVSNPNVQGGGQTSGGVNPPAQTPTTPTTQVPENPTTTN